MKKLKKASIYPSFTLLLSTNCKKNPLYFNHLHVIGYC